MGRLTAAVAAVLVLIVGCGDTAENEPAELPGDYADIIASETDCTDLQEIFDSAETAAGNMRDRGDIEQAEQYTAAMGAADERMREVGCYD